METDRVTETQKNINIFTSSFSSHKGEITKGLEEANDHKGGDENEQIKRFDNMFEVIASMKKLLADSTVSLPVYEIAHAQKTIEGLEELVSSTKQTIIPKKKFSFRSKKATSSSESSTNSSSTTLAQEAKVANTRSNIEVEDEHSISNIEGEDVFVSLVDVKESLRIFNARKCKFFIGVVSGSVFVDKCTDCIFMIASQQIRIHTSLHCDFYVYARSNPIIEQCSSVRFAPYKLSYPQRDTFFHNAKFDLSKNHWDRVEDFNWLKNTKSPNWSLIPVEQQIEKEITEEEIAHLQIR